MSVVAVQEQPGLTSEVRAKLNWEEWLVVILGEFALFALYIRVATFLLLCFFYLYTRTRWGRQTHPRTQHWKPPSLLRFLGTNLQILICPSLGCNQNDLYGWNPNGDEV